MKKDTFNDLKTMDMVDKLDNLINDHNDKFNEDAKQDFIDKLKDIYRKKDIKDALKKWKDVNDDQKNPIIGNVKLLSQFEEKTKSLSNTKKIKKKIDKKINQLTLEQHSLHKSIKQTRDALLMKYTINIKKERAIRLNKIIIFLKINIKIL